MYLGVGYCIVTAYLYITSHHTLLPQAPPTASLYHRALTVHLRATLHTTPTGPTHSLSVEWVPFTTSSETSVRLDLPAFAQEVGRNDEQCDFMDSIGNTGGCALA
jgi:hypothetical protein